MRKIALKSVAITFGLAVAFTATSLIIQRSDYPGNLNRGFPSSYFAASYTSKACYADQCQVNPGLADTNIYNPAQIS